MTGNASTTKVGVLALDVGTVRVGVAACRTDVPLPPQPLTTLDYAEPAIFNEIAALVRQHDTAMVAVGWPRGLEGQSTKQTAFVEDFVATLRAHPGLAGVSVFLQDEALTSRRAEEELRGRNKPFAKADVDALAATYILEDFLHSDEFARARAEVAHV